MLQEAVAKDQPGPQLDRRVAAAMGTDGTHDSNPSCVPYITSGPTDPPYSTDPVHISEMLAWLTKSRDHWAYRGDVDISLGSHDVGADMTFRVWIGNRGMKYSVPVFASATGKTIQHVLALLVCAVSKQELGE